MADTILEIFKGDDKTYELSVVDSDGTAVNLTGCTLKFTVKRYRTDAYTDAKIKKTSASEAEIKITDAAAGEAEIYVTDDDTKSLEAKTHWFDVELTKGGKIYTIKFGKFIVLEDVTDPS